MVRLQRYYVVWGAGEVDCGRDEVLVMDVADAGINTRIEVRRPRNGRPLLSIVTFL